MATKIKPVQPTEIKDRKMSLQIIEDIRKPIPPEVIEHNRKMDEYIEQFMKDKP